MAPLNDTLNALGLHHTATHLDDLVALHLCGFSGAFPQGFFTTIPPPPEGARQLADSCVANRDSSSSQPLVISLRNRPTPSLANLLHSVEADAEFDKSDGHEPSVRRGSERRACPPRGRL